MAYRTYLRSYVKLKKHVSGHSGAHTADGMRMNNLKQGCKGAGSPSKSVPHSASPTDSGRGTSLKYPVYVDTSTPTESGDHTDDGSPCPQRSRIATRVHTNPRLRVKLFHDRLLVSRTSLRKGHVVTFGPLGGGQFREQRYRNPPGHYPEADFGSMLAPKYNLPALQPKKNSVSA